MLSGRILWGLRPETGHCAENNSGLGVGRPRVELEGAGSGESCGHVCVATPVFEVCLAIMNSCGMVVCRSRGRRIEQGR